MPHITRRAVFLLPLLLASCGDDEAEMPRPVRRDFPPLRYGYLPPIRLNVQRVEMADGFIPPAGDREVSGASPVDVPDTLFAMARDRLKPVGTGGTATFRIETASIARRRDTLSGTLAVRLDVVSEDGASTGYAVARVTAAKSGPIPDQRAAIYDLLKSLMDDMNVELEFRLRNHLRSWIDEPAAAQPSPVPAVPPDAAPPGPADAGALPPPPPAPPSPPSE